MALTESNTVSLGTTAPDFELPDVVTGKHCSLTKLRGDTGTLILFICNHCPFVKHIEQGLRDLAADYRDTGITIIAISANDVDTYPEDAPQYMAEKEFPFPYLYDETQAVARAYDAACTPDIYLFNAQNRLVYHGQFDDARPGNDIEVTGKDVRTALDHLLTGSPMPTGQKPAIGCNIKWRS